jgi:hypothetical protein
VLVITIDDRQLLPIIVVVGVTAGTAVIIFVIIIVGIFVTTVSIAVTVGIFVAIVGIFVTTVGIFVTIVGIFVTIVGIFVTIVGIAVGIVGIAVDSAVTVGIIGFHGITADGIIDVITADGITAIGLTAIGVIGVVIAVVFFGRTKRVREFFAYSGETIQRQIIFRVVREPLWSSGL